MSDASDIYESYKLCAELKPKEVCVVLERCESGGYARLVHAHVPYRRISNDRRLELLRALILGAKRSADDELSSIISYFLNDRGRSPERRSLPVHVAYPEPGVLRTYCGTNLIAWSDQVVLPDEFRCKSPCT